MVAQQMPARRVKKHLAAAASDSDLPAIVIGALVPAQYDLPIAAM
jgi:hypothetical protein